MADIKLRLSMDGARVVAADVRGVTRELGHLGTGAASASARARAELDALGRGFQSLKTMAAGIIGAIGVHEIAGKLVSVQREFDVLNSSLVTVTGSTAAAAREFEWLKTFAAETPFGLAQVVDGFVKMKALGLDPSQEALTSYGNTASAMGKSLSDMIEAVADASTGEFERLKEFGIKAAKEGDAVTFTFQGVSTTIRNSAEEITGYLEAIGNHQFAGAMEERARTLDGAISELADTWDEMFRTINDGDAGSVIYDSVQLAIGAIQDAISIIEVLNGVTQDGADKSHLFELGQQALSTALEAIAVVGVNTAYVFSQIVSELRGLYEQASAFLSLDFSRASAIAAQMRVDAAAARVEVDRLSGAILNARQNAATAAADASNERQEEKAWTGLLGLGGRKKKPIVGSGGGGGKPKRGGGGRKRSGGGGGGAAKISDEARAYEQAMKAIGDAQLSASIAGENYTSTQRKLLQIMTAPEWAKMPETWRQTIASQAEGVINLELQARASKEYRRMVDSLKTSEEKRRDTMREQLGILNAMQGLSMADQTDMTRRILGNASEKAPEFAGGQQSMASAFGELGKIEEAREKLQTWYQDQLQMLADFRAQKGALIEEANARELDVTRQYNDQMREIESARLQTQLAGAQEVMGGITDVIRSTAGEQSGIYKAMFAIEKGFAIARSIVAIQSGIAQAAANPWPMNLAAMASVAAATASIISNISSVAVQFREKGGPVTKGQPYIVGEAGMELFVPSQSGSIIPNHRINRPSTGGGSGETNVTVNLVQDASRAGHVNTSRNNSGGVTVDAFVADIMGDGPMARSMSGAFGLRRAGR